MNFKWALILVTCGVFPQTHCSPISQNQNDSITSVPSSTLNPSKFVETISNEYYPFMYEVPPVVSFLVHNETLRKNVSIGNPYSDIKQVFKGDTAYWPIQYCGVHFINKGEGYILSDLAFDDEITNERCTWGFVGNQFCTPQIECPEFKGVGGECRSNYLQITDAGSSFVHHFCDEKLKPKQTPYTARDGVLDVVYRYNRPHRRPKFECWVKCVNYPVNFTVTGSNAVGNQPLKVVVHKPPSTVEDTIPDPQIKPYCKCGAANGDSSNSNRSTRVVGGRPTLPNQYPWAVGLISKTGKLPYCGASLISAEYVLTAQHCVEDEEVGDIIVVLNEHDFFNTSEVLGKTIRRGVVEVIGFTYYMESTFSGDIALLRLERPVPIQVSQFTPACLPSSSHDLLQGREVLAMGWGTTSGGPFASKSPKLLEVPLVVFPNGACNDYHPHSPPEPPQVLDNMLCAGYPEGGRDTCAGDSGGPLTVRMPETGRFAQIGVTSWGFGCAIRYNPGVFSRVSDTGCGCIL